MLPTMTKPIFEVLTFLFNFNFSQILLEKEDSCTFCSEQNSQVSWDLKISNKAISLVTCEINITH